MASGWVPQRPIRLQEGLRPGRSQEAPEAGAGPAADAVVKRIFDMALQGRSSLDIAKALNAEGVASAKGKQWLKSTVHTTLNNEAYTGTVVWGVNAKDGAPPVRVEKAFPALVSKRKFREVANLLRSRAPESVHPRRASSPYLLSGLAKCETCGKALTAAEAKSGKYTYYVCHSLLKKGKGTCKTPRLNSKKFESLIVSTIRENILTESNIRDLVKIVDEEMDGVAREQRKRLKVIEDELEDVKKRLGKIWHAVETTDIEMSQASDCIKVLWERKEKLEAAAEEARAALSKRRVTLDKMETITDFARDMREYLKNSELTQSRAFIRSFVKEIAVRPGKAMILYTMLTPEDSPIGGGDAAEVVLNGGVMSMGHVGGAGGTRTPYLILAKDALSLMSYSPTNLGGGGDPPNRQPHNGRQVFRPF